MYISATINTMFGRAAIPHRPMIQVAVTSHELHGLVSWLQRQATEAEQDGRQALADSLHWRAAALREAGR